MQCLRVAETNSKFFLTRGVQLIILFFRHRQSLNTVTCQRKLPSSCHSTNTTETKKLFKES